MARRVSKKEQAAARAIAAKDKVKNAKAHMRKNKKRPTMASYRKDVTNRAKTDKHYQPAIVARTIGASAALKRQQEAWDKANKTVKEHKSQEADARVAARAAMEDDTLKSTKPKATAKPAFKVTELSVEADKMLAAADKQDRADEAKEAQAYARTAKGLGVSEERAKKLVSQFDKEVGPGKQPEGGTSHVPPAKEAAKAVAKAPAKAPAKKVSLKGAPRPELPKKSDPEYKAKLSKFRKWFTANRSSPKKKAVAQPAIKPAKKAVVSKKATPSRTADLTALETRIKMKRESGQAIPASWLKAEKVAKAKAKVAKVAQASKRIPSSIDRLENEKEAARGRREMAASKANVAAAADRRANKGYAKEGAQDRALMAKSEYASDVGEAQRGKRKAFERTQRLKGDVKRRAAAKSEKQREDRLIAEQAEHDSRKEMQAKMSVLPGFRSK